jgi:hypothetical protein
MRTPVSRPVLVHCDLCKARISRSPIVLWIPGFDAEGEETVYELHACHRPCAIELIRFSGVTQSA